MMDQANDQVLECDVCVIGSGAGGGPIAYRLAKAGKRVIVLEKGFWYSEADFKKDEMLVRRRAFRSSKQMEPHVLETPANNATWSRELTGQFWGGNIVGGASNFMSGYFHRLKPMDFHLLSTFGPIAGANIVDWPITYDDLEPYYTEIERLVGISGKIVKHPFAEPRSTPQLPFPPTAEHPIAAWFDTACDQLGLNALPLARAILSRPFNDRKACEYSGYCGSYGCSTGAKGSSRVAFIGPAVATGYCDVITGAKARRIHTDAKGRASAVEFTDRRGKQRWVKAKIINIACYSIESIRLLLNSPGPKHSQGLGNHYAQVGKNLHCCAGGTGHGIFDLSQLPDDQAASLKTRGPFFNRALQDWYVIKDKSVSKKNLKGGTIDFVFDPPSPTADANSLKWENSKLIWGSPFKQKLFSEFTSYKDFKFEVFCDWLPNNDCHVSIDTQHKDKWGDPVAKIRAGFHPHDLTIAQYLVDKGVMVMKQMGAHKAYGNAFSAPTSNLIAGGLRFGKDPKTSVLDPDCRIHDCENVFVSDASFMPNGGSVTPTWTIYANALRIADTIKTQL